MYIHKVNTCTHTVLPYIYSITEDNPGRREAIEVEKNEDKEQRVRGLIEKCVRVCVCP